MKQLTYQLLTTGRARNSTLIRMLQCVLNDKGDIPLLVDFNCVDGLLLEHIRFNSYVGYHIDTGTIGKLKKQYPEYAKKLSAVDVFKFATGASMGATMAVALGLLHRQVNPIEAMYNLIKLHRPVNFVGSVITGVRGTQFDYAAQFTPVSWSALKNVPGLCGLVGMRIEDDLFYTLFEIETERILLNDY